MGKEKEKIHENTIEKIDTALKGIKALYELGLISWSKYHDWLVKLMTARSQLGAKLLVKKVDVRKLVKGEVPP